MATVASAVRTFIQQREPAIRGAFDSTYQRLLGVNAWQRLDENVRLRFSVKPFHQEKIIYRGSMRVVSYNVFGWFFAQLCRLIGTPLATYAGENIPLDVELSHCTETGGISWHRRYHFPQNKNITVSSTKCVGPKRNLVEKIGYGFFMELDVFERNSALFFESTGYFWGLGNFNLRIPDVLTPGKTQVIHTQLVDNNFRFTFSVKHPVLGETFFQEGDFYLVYPENVDW